MATEASSSVVTNQQEFDRIINSDKELYAIIRFFLSGKGNPIRLVNNRLFNIKINPKNTIGKDLTQDIIVKILSNKDRFDAKRGAPTQWIKYKIIECIQLKYMKYFYITKVPGLAKRFIIKPTECPIHIINNDWIGDFEELCLYEQFQICSIDIEKTLNYMAHMDERDSDIIISNCMFDIPMEELGVKYNVTRERIRQLRNRALTNIKKELSKEMKEDGTTQ